jgi:hypothetical protein
MKRAATSSRAPDSDKGKRSEAAHKALRTAKWARIMTKWMITRSSKGGVKWQVVSFNGANGQESSGIVDMIAIRKNHRRPAPGSFRGDLFEMVLVQVKGGRSKFPSQKDVDRLLAVQKHHSADKVVLTEWKEGKVLCCYVLPDMTTRVPASKVFGLMPSANAAAAHVADETPSKARRNSGASGT